MHIRLIPARAGNTTRASPSLVPSSAHPRSRGEHQLLDLCRSRNYGSSPLARGTLIALIGSVLVLRLIPARAGNTPGLSPPRRQWSAHPRSRGEHVLLKSGSVFDSGSSPLARGTRHVGFRVGRDTRLIPARAGNTFHASQNEILSAAHPRSRGEHTSIGLMGAVPPGSSPLARGTRTRSNLVGSVHRLIPARTGNTSTESLESVRDAAHPRSRGEHSCTFCSTGESGGSSPLSRGTRWVEAVGSD